MAEIPHQYDVREFQKKVSGLKRYLEDLERINSAERKDLEEIEHSEKRLRKVLKSSGFFSRSLIDNIAALKMLIPKMNGGDDAKGIAGVAWKVIHYIKKELTNIVEECDKAAKSLNGIIAKEKERKVSEKGVVELLQSRDIWNEHDLREKGGEEFRRIVSEVGAHEETLRNALLADLSDISSHYGNIKGFADGFLGNLSALFEEYTRSHRDVKKAKEIAHRIDRLLSDMVVTYKFEVQESMKIANNTEDMKIIQRKREEFLDLIVKGVKKKGLNNI